MPMRVNQICLKTFFLVRNNNFVVCKMIKGDLYPIKGLSTSLDINMSGSNNDTTSIGLQKLSQAFESPIPAIFPILLIVLGMLGITCLLYLVSKFLKKNFHHHSTTSIEPIFNIGTYQRRVSTVINIAPAHCDLKPCMSVWTGQDWKSKFDGHVRLERKVKFAGHAQPDQIKSKNSTNASEEKGKNLVEVTSIRKLDVMKLSELVDHEDKII